MLSLALSLAGFHLFAPVPAQQMRALKTDRPDLTAGPYTVDAGHVQLEMDAAVFSFQGNDFGLDVAGLNVRLGLTDSVDVHAILPTMGGVWDGSRLTPSPGDLQLRLKANVVGGNGGPFALALLPYLLVPADLGVTGGLIVPVNIELPFDFGLGSMVQLEAARNGVAFDARAVVSASLARSIVNGVGAYVEGLGETQVLDGYAALWAGAGATWQAGDDVQFDLGARALVAGDTPRLEAFAGLTLRR